MEINRLTLDNGLRVVHNCDTATAMVAVNLLYDVGARDESPDMTGLAHLFEHLMFAGSVNIPDFDAPLQRAGGMSNAWTSNDFTNFYDILPAHNIETAFWLESDRMLALNVTEESLQVQKSVVIEEFRQQCLNRPYGDMGHFIRQLSYKSHPYRFPVIGKDFSHIEKVSLHDINQFYETHYSPNNAVLAVSGNVTFDKVIEMVVKWFGSIPSRPIAPRLYQPEPMVEGPRSMEVTSSIAPLTAITLTYPMQRYGTTQYVAADLITDLLANGKSSRFYRRLALGTDIFADVDASILGSEEPGLLMVNAKLHDDKNVDRAIAMIDAQLDDLVENKVTQYEIDRAVNRMESAAMFANLNYLAKAQVIAMAEYHNEDVNKLIDRYRDLTPEIIRDQAAKIFNPSHRSTLIYHSA